jgi:hypothetical protein
VIWTSYRNCLKFMKIGIETKKRGGKKKTITGTAGGNKKYQDFLRERASCPLFLSVYSDAGSGGGNGVRV